MNRREFGRQAKVDMCKRATNDRGQIQCERCWAFITKWEYHHLAQDAMQIDKSRKLTVADGELLCIPCHKEESAAQAPVLAKIKRVEAKRLGLRNGPQRPLQSRGFAKAEKPKREGKPAMKPRELFRCDQNED